VYFRTGAAQCSLAKIEETNVQPVASPGPKVMVALGLCELIGSAEVTGETSPGRPCPSPILRPNKYPIWEFSACQ
jgi:hypothetical protein